MENKKNLPHINQSLIYKILDFFDVHQLENSKALNNPPILNKSYFTYLYNRKSSDFSHYISCNLKEIKDVIGQVQTLGWPGNQFATYLNEKGEQIAIFSDFKNELCKTNLNKENNQIKYFPSKIFRNIMSIRHFKIDNKDYVVTTSKDLSVMIWDEELSLKVLIYAPHRSDAFIITSLMFQGLNRDIEETYKFNFLVTVGYLSKEMAIFALKLDNEGGKPDDNYKKYMQLSFEEKVIGLEDYTHEGFYYILPYTNLAIHSYIVEGDDIQEFKKFESSSGLIETICLLNGKIISVNTSWNVNIWNLFNGELERIFDIGGFNKIDCPPVTSQPWNEKIIILGSRNSIFRMVDIESEKVLKDYKCWGTKVSTIRKVNSIIYGPCLYVLNDGNVTLFA